MNTGEKIVYQRKKHSITQEDLANEVGVSRQTVSKWEGNLALPDTASIARLADIFDVSTDYLIRDNVEEKEHVSQKKTLGLSVGLLIGFLALAVLAFLFSIVIAYATLRSLYGAIFFAAVWSLAMVGAIIVLSVYKSRCDYDEKDRHFLTGGTIGTLFAGILTFGMFLPLPISDRANFLANTPEIITIDFYWSWAFVGGAIALAIAFLLLPFILTKGRSKFINKENADFLFLGCFISAVFLLPLDAGIYDAEAVITLNYVTTILSGLIGAALIGILASRKALPIRSIVICPIIIFAATLFLFGYWQTIMNLSTDEVTFIYKTTGFGCLGLLSAYFLVEGIIARKRNKGFLMMLAFILLGSETLVTVCFALIPASASLGINFLAGYALLAAASVPGIILSIRYAKSLSQSNNPLAVTR